MLVVIVTGLFVCVLISWAAVGLRLCLVFGHILLWVALRGVLGLVFVCFCFVFFGGACLDMRLLLGLDYFMEWWYNVLLLFGVCLTGLRCDAWFGFVCLRVKVCGN